MMRMSVLWAIMLLMLASSFGTSAPRLYTTFPTSGDWIAAAVVSAREVWRHGLIPSHAKPTVRSPPLPVSQDVAFKHSCALLHCSSVSGVATLFIVRCRTGLRSSYFRSLFRKPCTIAACRSSADASGTVKELPSGAPPPESPPESSPPEAHAARSKAAAVTVAVALANLSLWRLLKTFDILPLSDGGIFPDCDAPPDRGRWARRRARELLG